jgi:cytochrome o ubiquinol oxidase operon protein cyoD
MSEPISQVEYAKTLKKYVSGFILSIALTFAAYVVVQTHLGSGNEVLAQPTVLWTIMAFAVAQLIVQMWYFLHLGEEARPHWRFVSLLFAISFVLIVVIGSMWIMANLDYNGHGTPAQVNKYLRTQDDL